MLLYDCFIALFGRKPHILSNNQLITTEDVAQARLKEIQLCRTLYFDSPIHHSATRVKTFKAFITFCEEQLKISSTYIANRLILLFLIDHSDETAPEDVYLYGELLTRLLHSQLQVEKHALAFRVFGQNFIASPLVFAAFLRCLLWLGVKPIEIIQTHCLHQYLGYHMADLHHTTTDPVAKLYQLLEQYPETRCLVSLASKITCEKLGPLDRQYSRAIRVRFNQQDHPLAWQVDEQYLSGLHQIFGVSYLYHALEQHVLHQDNPQWLIHQQTLFNQPHVVQCQLPALFDRIQENGSLQKALADVLQEDTLSALIANGHAGILCLLPYHPSLTLCIQITHLSHYVEQLKQHSQGLSLMTGLMHLLERLKDQDSVKVTLILNELLDQILEHRYVFDDLDFVEKLQQLSITPACVQSKIQTYETKLELILKEYITRSRPLTADLLISLQDKWREGSIKINDLQIISHCHSTYPADKFQWLARIAKRYFEQYRTSLEPTQFANLLSIPTVLTSTEVTEYERLLIELMASIDHELFRKQCAAILDQAKPRPWKKFLYGGVCLFERGIEHENKGLLRWLTQHHIKPKQSWDALALKACEQQRWAMMFYYCTQKLSRSTFDKLLKKTVQAQQTNIARQLLKLLTYSKMHQIKSIEPAFLIACQQNYMPTVSIFFHKSVILSETIVAKAIKQAVQDQAHKLVSSLLRYKNSAICHHVISDALFDAARKNQSSHLKWILPFASKEDMKGALSQAVKKSHLKICQILVESWSEKTQTKFQIHKHPELLKIARKPHNVAIFNYLTSVASPSPCAPTPNRTTLLKSTVITRGHTMPSALNVPTLRRAVSYDCYLNAAHRQHSFFSAQTQSPAPSPKEKRSLPRQISFST